MPTRNELPVRRGDLLRADFLTARLFDLTSRIKGIDPQLTRVLVPWVMRHRRYVPGFLRLARTVAQSSRVRARWLARGVRVPPFLVLSVTSKCNLRCAGCYAGAVGTVTNAPAQPGLGLKPNGAAWWTKRFGSA